jgi:hypothetical protein
MKVWPAPIKVSQTAPGSDSLPPDARCAGEAQRVEMASAEHAKRLRSRRGEVAEMRLIVHSQQVS